MKAVDYVSSMFLGLCVKVGELAGTKKLALTHVHPEIKKVFKIAGLDRQIRIS
jgi:anti-anti-sigma regulatory factor